MAAKVVHLELDWLKLIKISTTKAAEAVLNIGLAVESEAKANAPVDTGALRNSIRAERLSPTEVAIRVGVEYGYLQEIRRSYLGKALDDVSKNNAASIVKATFDL